MIPLPNQLKIIKKEDNIVSFEIEGLYPGYGVTFGNTIRRILLSSLEGAAITKVKIMGIQHEFSTIPGVVEDSISILLNLKQLKFKIFTDEPQKAVLKIKGEKEVNASDFKLPPQVELINKDAHIATLSDKKAELEIEITIEKGVGYEPVERRKKGKLLIGEMPLDAIFTPVRKVSYRVENMRVGERIDFDKLMINLETDGSVTPEEAFTQAFKILINHFDFFVKEIKIKSSPLKEKKVEKIEKKEADQTKTSIEDLKLSARTLSVLENNSIKSIAGITRKSEKSLLDLDGMGEKSLKEIKKALEKKGLELKK